MTYYYGISGYVGSGKDTFGLMLGEELDIPVDSFAAPMREIAQAMHFQVAIRSLKEIPIKHYGDFGEKLQNVIADKMGYLEDNTQAELYAFLIDLLEPHWITPRAEAPYYYLSPRQFLQYLGQAGRRVNPNFWIEALTTRNDGRVGGVLVTDVRYIEEAHILEELIFIHREGCGPVNGHESEQHYETLRKMADIEIFNNGTLADLKDNAETVKGILA